MSLRWGSEVKNFLKRPQQETFLESSEDISVQPSVYTFNFDVVYKALFEELNWLRNRPKTGVKNAKNRKFLSFPDFSSIGFSCNSLTSSHTLLPSTYRGMYLRNPQGVHRTWTVQLSTGRQKCMRKLETVEHHFFTKWM